MSDEAQKRIFSKNLRRLLEESGKTQKELAEAIGESQQVVNTWAIGRSIPRMGRVQKLADFFGVEKSVLVDEWREGEEPQIPQFSNIFPISKKAHADPWKNRLWGTDFLQRGQRKLHCSGHGRARGLLPQSAWG